MGGWEIISAAIKNSLGNMIGEADLRCRRRGIGVKPAIDLLPVKGEVTIGIVIKWICSGVVGIDKNTCARLHTVEQSVIIAILIKRVCSSGSFCSVVGTVIIRI